MLEGGELGGGGTEGVDYSVHDFNKWSSRSAELGGLKQYRSQREGGYPLALHNLKSGNGIRLPPS